MFIFENPIQISKDHQRNLFEQSPIIRDYQEQPLMNLASERSAVRQNDLLTGGRRRLGMSKHQIAAWRYRVFVEVNHLLGKVCEVAQTNEFSQCGALGSGVEIGRPTLGYDIVDVYGSEVDGEACVPRSVGHGPVQLRAGEENEPTGAADDS